MTKTLNSIFKSIDKQSKLVYLDSFPNVDQIIITDIFHYNDLILTNLKTIVDNNNKPTIDISALKTIEEKIDTIYPKQMYSVKYDVDKYRDKNNLITLKTNINKIFNSLKKYQIFIY